MQNDSTQDTKTGEITGRQIAELVELIQSPDAEIEQIVEVLEKFTGMRDALVNRANSPEFALRNQISRVEHAIAVLGSRRTAETIRLQHPTHQQQKPHFAPRAEQPAKNSS